jgi:hypothetical protein
MITDKKRRKGLLLCNSHFKEGGYVETQYAAVV